MPTLLSASSTLPSTPLLEWSYSRWQRFDACRRAAYYATDLAREGWRAGASEDARLARRLKTLTALPLVRGQALHERAAEIACAIRAGAPLPSLVQMRERTRHTLRHAWLTSRDRRAEWERYPTRVPMLREWYYGTLPSPDQLATMRDQVEHGLITLGSLAYWGEVGAASPDNVILVDKFASYTLPALPPSEDGTFPGSPPIKVYAAPDLLVIADDGIPEVTDFKIGCVPKDAGSASASSLSGRAAGTFATHLRQVISYAVFLRHGARLLGPGQGCRGRLIYLGDGTEVPFEISARETDAAERRIALEALLMSEAEAAAEHAATDAVIEAREAGVRDAELSGIVERARRESPGYEVTSNPATCRDCPFREVCTRHQETAAPVRIAVAA